MIASHKSGIIGKTQSVCKEISYYHTIPRKARTMNRTKKRKIAAVIAIWLVFMLAAGCLLYASTKRVATRRV